MSHKKRQQPVAPVSRPYDGAIRDIPKKVKALGFCRDGHVLYLIVPGDAEPHHVIAGYDDAATTRKKQACDLVVVEKM